MTAPSTDPIFGADAMLDLMPAFVNRYRVSDRVITYCNASWAELYETNRQSAVGKPLDDFLSANEMEGLHSQLGLLCPDNPVVSDVEARAVRGDHGRWLEWVDRFLPTPNGPQILSVGRDVTDQHLAEIRLVESEQRFRDLADKSSDIVWRIVGRPVPHLEYVSPSVENLLGYPQSHFLDSFASVIDVTDGVANEILSRLLRGEPVDARFDLRFRHRDGSTIIGETSITTVRHGIQGVTRDVTELRRLQTATSDLARRDPLTGLGNRRLFDEHIAAELDRTKAAGLPLAVAFIDLDRLKSINDEFGHGAGDLVLQEAARRLTLVVDGSRFVARLGGDEFAIVYEPTDEAMVAAIDALDEYLATPITITDDLSVRCTASIGVGDTRITGYHAADLLEAADRAMYGVKNARRLAAAVPVPVLI